MSRRWNPFSTQPNVQEAPCPLVPLPTKPFWVKSATMRRSDNDIEGMERGLRTLLRPFFEKGDFLLEGRRLTTLDQLASRDGLLGAWVGVADLLAQQHGETFVQRWVKCDSIVGVAPVAWEEWALDVPGLMADAIVPHLRQSPYELAHLFSDISTAAATGKLKGLEPSVLAWKLPHATRQDIPFINEGLELDEDGQADFDLLASMANEILQLPPGVTTKNPTQESAGIMEPNPYSAFAACADSVGPGRRSLLISEGTPPQRERDREIYDGLINPLRSGLKISTWPAPEVFMQLRREFPWATEACRKIEHIAELAHYVGQPFFRLPPLLMIGAPGCGKTRFVQRLATLAGVPRWGLSGAGRNNGQMLVGTERAWSNGQPSSLIQFMVQHDTANPLVLIDELDKAAKNTQYGDLPSALLPFLEPESAKRISDDFLMAEVDFRQISWIATANETEMLAGPLLSRFTVIHMDRPRAEHLPVLIDGVRADLAEQFGVSVDKLPEWSETDLAKMRSQLGQTFSAREVRMACESALALRARHNRMHVVQPIDRSM